MSNSDLARLKEGRHPSILTRSAMDSKSHSTNRGRSHSTRAQHVRYIVPQMDPVAGTFTQAAAQSPSRLFVSDAVVLLSECRYLPNVLLPRTRYKNSNEDYLAKTKTRDVILQCLLFIIELVMILIIPLGLVILPGLFSILLMAFCWLIIKLLLLPMQGARVTYSKINEQDSADVIGHEGERWIFVNGIMTGHGGLQENIDIISQTFRRPVVGIHNQTYGFLFDLIECLIQRCFSYNTLDVRVTYDYLKACLYDPSIKHIVLIGHSQGGLIISMTLNHLYAEVPRGLFSKLEVYTFGSAAKHFNNPPLEANGSHLETSVKHIEHYANEKDMVARWGPLYNIDSVPSNRYSGRVFERKGGSGHLFVEHYLSVMFPLPSFDPTNSSESIAEEPGISLDQVVKPDSKLALRRSTTAWKNLDASITYDRRHSMFAMTDESIATSEAAIDHDPAVGLSHEDDEGSVRNAQGKTVRQLSRFWKYLGGTSPED